MEAIILIAVEAVSVCAIFLCLHLCGYEVDISVYKRISDPFFDDDDDDDDIFVNLPVNFGPYFEDDPEDDMPPGPPYEYEVEWGKNPWNPVNRIMNDVNLN